MSRPPSPRTFICSILLLALSATIPAFAQLPASAPPDSTLYTSYILGTGYQTVSWFVCGSTQESEGCFASGSLGPFGQAGAMIEGNPSVNGNVVTRAIYVVDSAAGTSGTGVKLSIYKKTDTVTSSTDTVSVTLVRTATLPLIGGATALCSLGANNGFLFIGTDQSPNVVRVQKSNLVMTQFGGFSPPLNVSAVTTDKYGYVAVTYGGFGTTDANIEFGPDGQEVGDGGGAWVMLGTTTGLSTLTLPTTDRIPTERMAYHPKLTAPTATEK